MGKVFIGTCSWSDRSMVDQFYPHGLAPRDQISYYARHFPTVEINSSFYHMPSERNTAAWAARTPVDFIFHAKAFGPMTTHRTEWNGQAHNRATPDMLSAWQDAVQPLKNAGKLGYTLLQFPRWFMPSSENRQYIEWCQDNLPNSVLAVEFRNGYWTDDKRRESTWNWLKDRGLAYVCVDEPQTGPKGSAPALYVATRPDLAILRLHGRNTQSWEKPGVGVDERFNWNYSKDTLLGEIKQNVESLRDAVERVFVMFNNVHNGYGVSNAQLLLTAIGGVKPAGAVQDSLFG